MIPRQFTPYPTVPAAPVQDSLFDMNSFTNLLMSLVPYANTINNAVNLYRAFNTPDMGFSAPVASRDELVRTMQPQTVPNQWVMDSIASGGQPQFNLNTGYGNPYRMSDWWVEQPITD